MPKRAEFLDDPPDAAERKNNETDPLAVRIAGHVVSYGPICAPGNDCSDYKHERQDHDISQ